MSFCQAAARPLARCVRSIEGAPVSVTIRGFSQSSAVQQETVQASATKADIDPNTAATESQLSQEDGDRPVWGGGSRRRRAALQSSQNIPFEHLPFQCFQEARKILQADREEKLKQMEVIRQRKERMEEAIASNPEKKAQLQQKSISLSGELDKLGILADINDPLIKKRFEDGQGDMSKPIYRLLAEKKWRSYRRKVLVQRIEQFNITPDLHPKFEPTVDTRMFFKGKAVSSGDYVNSLKSEEAPTLFAQVFDKGERLVTVAVMDPDHPSVEDDGFKTKCHFLATNIPLDPTQPYISLSKLDADKIVYPWVPPHAHKGSPYHRLVIMIFNQLTGEPLNVSTIKSQQPLETFSLRGAISQNRLSLVGSTLFRSIWDENTAEVMERAGIKGADIEFRREKIEALKPKKKPRGWEARHSHPKYKIMKPERFLP